jgi:hypothetical protein
MDRDYDEWETGTGREKAGGWVGTRAEQICRFLPAAMPAERAGSGG